MQKHDKPGDASMDEILASIRKIIAEEPPGSVAIPKAPPPPVMAPSRSSNAPVPTFEFPPLGGGPAKPSLSEIDSDIADLIEETPQPVATQPVELKAPEPARETPKRSGWLFGRSSQAAAPVPPPAQPPMPGPLSRRPSPMTDAVDIAKGLGRRGTEPSSLPSFELPPPGQDLPARPAPALATPPGTARLSDIPASAKADPSAEPRSAPLPPQAAPPRDFPSMPAFGSDATAAAVAVAEQLARSLPSLQPEPTPAMAPVQQPAPVPPPIEVVAPAPAAEVNVPEPIAALPPRTPTPPPAPAAQEQTPVAVSEPEPVPQAPVATAQQAPVRLAGHAATVSALINGGADPAPSASAAEAVPPPSPPVEPATSAQATPARTLEEAVAEMLRPMLRDWLDQHMPAIVERALRQELVSRLPSVDRS